MRSLPWISTHYNVKWAPPHSSLTFFEEYKDQEPSFSLNFNEVPMHQFEEIQYLYFSKYFVITSIL